MKKLGAMLSVMGLFLVLAGSVSAASTTFTNLPFARNSPSECIGGDRCGGANNVISVIFPQQLIQHVAVFAHDNVGSRTEAHLEVYVDGALVGRLDVKKDGAWLHYPIGRVGSSVVFRSVHKSNAPSGDETVVRNIVIN